MCKDTAITAGRTLFRPAGRSRAETSPLPSDPGLRVQYGPVAAGSTTVTLDAVLLTKNVQRKLQTIIVLFFFKIYV